MVAYLPGDSGVRKEGGAPASPGGSDGAEDGFGRELAPDRVKICNGLRKKKIGWFVAGVIGGGVSGSTGISSIGLESKGQRVATGVTSLAFGVLAAVGTGLVKQYAELEGNRGCKDAWDDWSKELERRETSDVQISPTLYDPKRGEKRALSLRPRATNG